MKYVVVSLSGKQRRLQEGKMYKADRFEGPVAEVLLYVDEDQVEIGQPLVENVGVQLVEVEHLRDKKIEIRRYHAKSRRRRKKGHRQPITKFTVGKIGKGVDPSLEMKE